jgi:hypothetical protein
MTGAGVTGNVVAGNFIGTTRSGSAALANSGNGVTISGGATGNLIESRNLISGNSGAGVLITGTGTSQNAVTVNGIGTNSATRGAVPNGGPGIEISNGATDNTIGGAGAGNLISGNAGDGVLMTGAGVTGNVVAGNYIGSDITGAAALANGGNGVTISGGAMGNTIGGSTTADRNVISGNNVNGVVISGAGTNQNTVTGNYIGINAQDTGRLANAQNGVVIRAGASFNTIGGALSSHSNIIAGNGPASLAVNGPGGHGILITDAGTNRNWVAADFIGTDANGQTGIGNIRRGVQISTGASYNLIGVDVADGGTAAERNVISGNGGSGVLISGDGTNYNAVAGNYLGVTPDGEHVMGNGQPLDTDFISGDVLIIQGPEHTQIGTSGTHGPALDALERNIISGGNTSAVGVIITDASNNHVAGNYIGTDATGTQLLGNAYSGVLIQSGSRVSQGNIIGVNASDPYAADEFNIIAGNGFTGLASDQADPANAIGFNAGVDGVGYAGVSIVSEAASGTMPAFISANNIVAGNYMGTNPSGATGLGNGQTGIYLFGAQGTVISANVVSGNGQSGITIDGTFPTNNTTVIGNLIGTDASGTVAVPNAGPGIQIINGAANNTVGGVPPGAGNTISSNSGAGVEVLGAASVGNQIRGNSIYANGALGIDLGGDGVTLNHIGAEPGPNNFQNYPIVNAARHGPTTRVVGMLNGLANTTYTLAFYASTSADPSGYGQGQRYLGSSQVTTDGSGNAIFDSNSFVTPLGAGLQTEFITATATDSTGNTSEFSAAVLANAGPVAANDSYLVQQNSANNSLNVLTNDYDQVGDSFNIISTSTPGHGTAVINGNNILYTPTAGYYGSDSFTYTISDAYGDTSTATVAVTVAFHPVTITGNVFRDLNDNHIQDSGESGLSGWTVQLDGGAVTAVTNAAGNYTFTGVGPGSHMISEVVQSAYIETSPRGDAYTINTSNGLNVSGENFSNAIPTNARDNSLPGYTEAGKGWATINSGWLGNSRTHAVDATGKTYASWTLNTGSAIPAGKYEVFVTYVSAPGRATNAPYTIADNKTILGTVVVDQTQAPGDGLYQGILWRSLGVFTFNSGKPIVTLNANANGVIDADGVLLIPAPAYAPPLNPLLGAALAPQNPASSVSSPTAKTGSARSAIDHVFSYLSAHPATQGVWLGGATSTAPAAIVDAAFADQAPDADAFGDGQPSAAQMLGSTR